MCNMATWVDLPSDVRRVIIYMGKEMCAQELLKHKETFDNCLFHIKHNVHMQKKFMGWIRYWLRAENISHHYYY